MPRRKKDTTEVIMPVARESELILPEFFAREVMKKGKISYKLVNPMTKTRNLASRKGVPVIKLSRRPVEHIVVDETNREIPIALFPKKDREMIKNHFRVVEHNKRIPFAEDVPLSKPFKNKERGRPTHLPKNIAYHKRVQKNMVKAISPTSQYNTQFNAKRKLKVVESSSESDNDSDSDMEEIVFQAPAPKKRGRKPKYATAEERAQAKREQTLASNYKKYHERKAKKGTGIKEDILDEVRELKHILVNHIKQGGNTPVSHQEGMGVISSITNLGKKAYNSVKKTATKAVSTAKDVATKVITGNTGMPPNVKSMLAKYGNSIISGMTIARNPVGSALVSALNVASMGDFKKNLDNSPYDKLFHLKLILTLQNGIKLALEKVERVSLTKYTKPVKGQEDMDVPVEKQITLDQLYKNAEIAMGDRFYPYSARDNNCQNFILNVLKASGIGGERDYNFVKQDTKSLFGDESFLRKLSNTITDIGARFNVLLQGGGMKGKGVRKVYPPDYHPKDFISLPNYLQSDALAGNIVLGDNTTDDDGESGTGIEKGAFRKSFYSRQAKYKHIKSLEEYARYIVEHPSDFSMKVRKRAQFLVNLH